METETEPYSKQVGLQINTATLEITLDSSQKIKIELPRGPAIYVLGVYLTLHILPQGYLHPYLLMLLNLTIIRK